MSFIKNMLSEISLRRLEMSDAPAVLAIYRSAGGPNFPIWSLEATQGELLMSPGGLGAFLSTGELVAFAIFHYNFDEIAITNVATRPDYQGQGIMSLLFKKMFENEGTMPFWLEVHETNIKARKFYEKFSFREIGRRPKYYNDNTDAIMYSTRPSIT